MMKFDIHLSDQEKSSFPKIGFSWTVVDHIYFKGFAFNKNNELIDGDEGCKIFANITDIELFIKTISSLSGQFCVINQRNDEIWLAVDRVRSLPLFYTYHSGNWLISDLTTLLLKYEKWNPKWINSEEFLATAYVTGLNTLIENVFQLQPSEIVVINQQGAKSFRYYNYCCNAVRLDTIQILEKEFRNIVESSAKRMIAFLNGRKALIPLSGGYDSRFIAYMLKKYNYNKVQCFTYGKKNNKEIANAKATAEKLGFPWLFIDYENINVTECFQDPIFLDYYPFLANHSSMLFFQEYFAVKYLFDNELTDKNSVFIPGHSFDFLAGSHLQKEYKKVNKEKISELIYYANFYVVEPTVKFKKNMKKKILSQIAGEFLIHSVFENFDLMERQAKFIINSARVYDFFGYQYYLVLWDLSWIEFFKDLPFELKLYKKFFNNIVTKLFGEYNINFIHELQPTPAQYIQNSIKKKIANTFPFLKKLKHLPVDDHLCSGKLATWMINDMKKNNFKYFHTYYFIGIYVQWYLMQLRKEETKQ
jgi:asparagine synthase (glutamine-hydrolysing)